MLGSQTHPEIWRKQIEPTQKFYSWVINNHWGTNYRAYQDGLIEFRYGLRPHEAYDSAEASRFAVGLSQPLVVSAAGKISSSAMMLRIEPTDILVQECKPSSDRTAWIVRLFGSSGEERLAKLSWGQDSPIKLWLSNLNEEKLKEIGAQVEIGPWELVTVRIEPSHT
jgi:alpha-mannosidase